MKILLSATIKDKSISAPTKEILGMARKIADKTGAQIAVALLGADVSSFNQELIESGADIVYVTENENLLEHHINIYFSAFRNIVERVTPNLIIFPGDSTGKDLAPRVAYWLESGLVMDCIDFEVEGRNLIFIKPVYGGKAIARMKVTTPVALITVRPKTQEPFPRDVTRTGERIIVEAKFDSHLLDSKVIERVEEEGEEIDLEDSEVVVSGGRGLGNSESFKQLKHLAKILNGAVGASRPAVDQGWVAPSYQIGQTGKIVTPNVYFAIGISGASQHLAGMMGSKFIVAINRDPEAPILKIANLGIIDDYREVIPTLIDELTRIIGK